LAASKALKQGGREFPPSRTSSPVAKATAAERSGMPAGGAVVHRTAAAIGPAVPARSAATGDADGVARCGLIERRQRHGLRSGHRRKADADSEQRCSKNLHMLSFLLHATKKTNPDHAKTTIEPTSGSPVTAMPVTPVPVASVPAVSAPAPVTPVPMPVPVVASPAHLLRFEAIDVFLRDHRGFGVSARRWRYGRLGTHRRQWCCLRARRQRRGTGGKTKSNFYKVTTFHDIFLFRRCE
jgi:hypothetical protein